MDLSFLQFGNAAKVIDEQGKDHEIDLLAVARYIAEGRYTVKVEGLEGHFSEYKNKTVHCFVAPKGATSFPDHRDPCDLEIHCLEGTKTMIVDGTPVAIPAGSMIFIPAYVLHRATNEHASVMLSVGYE